MRIEAKTFEIGDHVRFNYNRRHTSVKMIGHIERIGKKFAYIKTDEIVYYHYLWPIVNAIRVPLVDVLEVVK